eukprot:2560851-Pyramimonas_sp.AAC.1
MSKRTKRQTTRPSPIQHCWALGPVPSHKAIAPDCYCVACTQSGIKTIAQHDPTTHCVRHPTTRL